ARLAFAQPQRACRGGSPFGQPLHGQVAIIEQPQRHPEMGSDAERNGGTELAGMGGDGGELPGGISGLGEAGVDQFNHLLRIRGGGKTDSGDDPSRYLRHPWPLQLRPWSPIWVDRTGFCFSSVTGTLRWSGSRRAEARGQSMACAGPATDRNASENDLQIQGLAPLE